MRGCPLEGGLRVWVLAAPPATCCLSPGLWLSIAYQGKAQSVPNSGSVPVNAEAEQQAISAWPNASSPTATQERPMLVIEQGKRGWGGEGVVMARGRRMWDAWSSGLTWDWHTTQEPITLHTASLPPSSSSRHESCSDSFLISPCTQGQEGGKWSLSGKSPGSSPISPWDPAGWNLAPVTLFKKL